MFPPNSPTASFPYRIEGQVGVGSMGVVYRAKEVDLDRTVAIKILRQSMLDEETPTVRDELQRRFLQEAKAAAALSHPGVTTVYRVGTEAGVPFIVMEWLAGRTLEDLLQERKRLEVAESARFAAALLETLSVAHAAGVVHRDIKPSNLVVLSDGRLKVTDFGIAFLQGRELVKTQAGVVLATPKFASPEQLRGIEVDGRADLFATGILLYRMVTGFYPFNGTGFMELANAILQEEPLPPRDLRPDVPPALEAVVRTALKKDRQSRYPTAQAMLEDLRPFVHAESTGVGPASGYVPLVSPQAEATARLEPVSLGLSLDPAVALAELVGRWPGQTLPKQATRQLLARLLDKPLHTAAFSGAATLGHACLLVCGGRLVGAVDTASGRLGDAVLESLPVEASAILRPLPESLPGGLVSVLTSALHPPVARHADLDSSFVNLPALALKLKEERFDGFLRLRHAESWALIVFVQGESALNLYSEGWSEVPVEHSWQRWVGEVSVRASVEEKVEKPLNAWYRHAYHDFELQARPVEKGAGSPTRSGSASSSKIRQLFSSTRANPLATGRLVLRLSPGATPRPMESVSYEESPSYRFLAWALESLPPFFAERDRGASWKYLSEWLPKVRKAWLHHDLPRPDSRETDFFDLVTADEKGKILHLGQRVAQATPKTFERWLERVIAAKTARIKSGDIGGAFFVAPQFSDELLTAYTSRIQGGSGLLGMEESFTGYSGFVRIGARRGFHLLLVEEQGERQFMPRLPG